MKAPALANGWCHHSQSAEPNFEPLRGTSPKQLAEVLRVVRAELGSSAALGGVALALPSYPPQKNVCM